MENPPDKTEPMAVVDKTLDTYFFIDILSSEKFTWRKDFQFMSLYSGRNYFYFWYFFYGTGLPGVR